MPDKTLFGNERREEVQDPNAGPNVAPAVQVPVGGVSTPRGVDVSRVGSDLGEISQAMGEFGGHVANYFDSLKEQWRLEGQLDYTQGKTLNDLHSEGNLYTTQGWQAMQARTDMGNWYQTKMSDIASMDHQQDPTAYKDGLMKNYAEVSKNAPTDPYVRKMMGGLAQQYFPALVESQTKAHNEWNRKNSVTSYTNMAVQQASQVDGNNPGSTVAAVSKMFEPGASGLSKDDEEEGQANALTLGFQQGNDTVWQALGGIDGLKQRGWSAEHLSAAATNYDHFNQTADADMARSVQSQLDTVVSKAQLDGNIPGAQKNLDAIFSTLKSNPRWIASTARQTPLASIAQQLQQYHPDWTQAQYNAALAAFSNPAVMNVAAQAWGQSQNGQFATPEAGTAAIQAVAKAANIAEQDVPLVFKAFKQNQDQWALDAAAKVQGALSKQIEESNKQLARQNALKGGTMFQLSSGDQQTAIGELRSTAYSEWQAKNAAGQANGETAEQYVERQVFPMLAKQNITEDVTKSTITSAFSRDVLEPDGKVNQRAMQAYDLLIRMARPLDDPKGGYGLTPSQVDAYLGNEDSKNLYHMIKTFDIGDMDTATAIRAATNQLNKKQTQGEEVSFLKKTIGEGEINKMIAEQAKATAGWGNVNMGPSFGFSQNTPGGQIAHSLFAGDDIWQRELDRAMQDSNLKQAIYNRATIETAVNPNLSSEAAVRKAASQVMGRSEFVLGTFVQSGELSTIREDMGIQTPVQNAVHTAAVAYLLANGNKPVEDGGFGPKWNRVKPDPANKGIMQSIGNFFSSDGLRAPLDAPGIDAITSRGVPDMVVHYDPQQKMFYFNQYDDQSMDSPGTETMHVSAKDLGDFYKKNESAIKSGAFMQSINTALGATAGAVKTQGLSILEGLVKSSIGVPLQ